MSAVAHPLGNFTVNHLARIRLVHGRLLVRYVLDIAEIPSFQIMHGSEAGGSWSRQNAYAWAQTESSTVASGLQIRVDGRRVALTAVDASAHTRPGSGGLPTLYWTGDFAAPFSIGRHDVDVVDTVYSHRIGWKDIVAGNEREPTDALTHYPSGAKSSPREVTQLTFDAMPDGSIHNVVSTQGTAYDASSNVSLARSNLLSKLFSTHDRAPLFVAFTFLVAFGLGALHALEPGHGKALLAFTLVGSRATVRQALILAASLTIAHTAAVFALGVVLFFVAGFAAESIYPWIALVSGIAVAVIGARNLSRYLHDRMPHDHEHASDGHSHAIPGNAVLDFRAAIIAAMSGGIAPCPAAIVVMLAALRLHQLGYGLLVIVIFSVGLASVLTGLGIAVVRGSAWISASGRFDRLVAFGPMLSSAVISIVGAIMLAQALVMQGVRAPMWLLAAVAVAAIAGYAFSSQHTHAHAAAAVQ
ncbi:MAG TPA: hypothetical protein VFN49_11775 [Candidatus Aquilonibacter sp.]|nr:hypothetical protein [Candidatus Aquilonibacter sp.]